MSLPSDRSKAVCVCVTNIALQLRLEGWRYQGVARPVNIFPVLVVPAADNLLEASVHGLTALQLSAFSTLY